MQQPAVYFVDDTQDYRFLVQQVFRRFLPQYQLTLFANGQDLLTHFQASGHLPGLILLDLHMPGLDGLQVLSRLKQEPRHKPIPVVILTSSSSQAEIDQCYQAGANSCLLKPTSFEQIQVLLSLVGQYWLDTNRPFVDTLPH